MYDLDQENIEKLLEDSVAEICQHENFPRFLRWMQERMGVRRPTLFSTAPQSELLHLATMLALAIWNVVPLPGQGFQIKKIAFPEKNQVCICGSGRKFINCCDIGTLPFEPLDCDIVWPLVFACIPSGVVKDGLVKNLIPLDGRIRGAIACLEKGRPKKALTFLEALFSSESLTEVGEDGAFALSLLLDAFGMLGFAHKKSKMIAHIMASAPASPLRSESYQQLAAMQMDQGQVREAWISFRKAQIDTPDDCKVGLLEVQLLLAERRFDRAQERAGFLLKRMRRQGGDDVFALDFLKEVARDPRRGGLRIEFASIQDLGLDLVGWLEKVASRPLPAYCWQVPGQRNPATDSQSEMALIDFILVPPVAVQTCEEAWDAVCPVEMTQEEYSSGFLWQADADYGWIDFLCRCPESFDSLTVLGEVLLLLDLHPNREMPGFRDCIWGPVLDRTLAITEGIITGLPDNGCLPWIIAENRSFLWVLYKYSLQLLQDGEREDFFRVAEKILKINPNDEHGVRTGLVNCCLDEGKYRQALAVCSRYPDDTLPEILYGRALAFYCLGERQDACRALEAAVKKLPRVADYLLAGRVRMTEEDEQLREAYYYREEMRPVWKASGKALVWLKKSCPNPSC
ncbi:MAG: hypothetical protein P4L42_07555 [Desulfocapsaceae bacterium]|nr:hypothetical protein [Desulfocapsaceae bacterium]